MTIIEVRGLRKDFTVRVKAGRLRRERRTVAAVDGVDLTVSAGEMLGYIGPNGAGKSTTLKMLTGVLYPSAGSVRVCGFEPVPERTRLARRIGVVFGQRSQLWWDLPLRESFELLRHVYRVPAAEHGMRLKRCRELLDLDGFADTPVRQLSLGQRMRTSSGCAGASWSSTTAGSCMTAPWNGCTSGTGRAAGWWSTSTSRSPHQSTCRGWRWSR
jgi:viologen exporter family transport system ATP-binding protein